MRNLDTLSPALAPGSWRTGGKSRGERAADLARRARAIRRLMSFLSITVVSTARCRFAGPSTAARVGIAQGWAKSMLRRTGVHVERRGAVPAAPAILVANHRSYLDIPVLAAAAPSVFLAKHEIAGWPVLGNAGREIRTIFVDRQDRSSRKAALARIRQALRSGLSVTLFPEGTTTRGPGLLPFRPGVFYLACEERVPVIPVAVCYDDPELAWVDDDPFLEHFLTHLGDEEIRASTHFGPEMRAGDGETLRRSAEEWIAEDLGRTEWRLRAQASPTASSARSDRCAANSGSPFGEVFR